MEDGLKLSTGGWELYKLKELHIFSCLDLTEIVCSRQEEQNEKLQLGQMSFFLNKKLCAQPEQDMKETRYRDSFF